LLLEDMMVSLVLMGLFGLGTYLLGFIANRNRPRA